MSTSAEPGRTWPLVGRAAELDDLDDLLSTAADGVGVTVLLEGEAGVGKTSLVDALRGSARLLDVELRTAQATEMRGWPFALLSDALLRALRPGARTRRSPSRPSWRTCSTRCTPTRPAPSPGTTGRRSCSRPSCAATVTSGRGPSCSRTCTRPTPRRSRSSSSWRARGRCPRALVVLTMRPVPYRPELAELVAAWTRAGARYLELRPLSARATVELAENLVGGPVGPSLRGTLATTGGNPRLVADVVRTARAAGALVAVRRRARLDRRPAG